MQRYRRGHNENDSKHSFVSHSTFREICLTTALLLMQNAFWEIAFSQFSRKNHAFFSHFRMTFEKIVVGSSDNLIHFGGILKWLKSPVLKTGRTVQCRRGGSNPSASARALEHYVPRLFFFFVYHHAVALATTTYHKEFYKSRDYSGLYGF